MSETMNLRYPCPCCGSEVLEEPAPGSYEICPVCGWEDDDVQFREPDLEGGANAMSLNQARANYAAFGSCTAPDESGESPAKESAESGGAPAKEFAESGDSPANETAKETAEAAEEESDEDYREDL